MASSVLYLLAVRDGSLAVVGLLASLAPVSTVILARVLLKEPTYLWQRLGAGLALGSVVLLAISLARSTRLSSQTGSSLS